MNNLAPSAIRLTITKEVRKALDRAKKLYPTLSDPEILKLGLSKIVTENYEESANEKDRDEIRKNASVSVGLNYLDDPVEDIYTSEMGKKVRLL